MDTTDNLGEVLARLSNPLLITTTALTTLGAASFLRNYLYPAHPKVLPSPLKTIIPTLSPSQLASLDYKLDHFAGSRDIPSPYGSIRAYEFGPEDGRKTLLVHGISTSSMTLGPIANALAAKGCRVLIFDLFGRGFSDGVGDVPHDARLYVSQMLCVLASSPLAWSGDAAFDLVGYSMGGGVVMQFVAAFPRMVRSVALLAPAGLIRAESFGISRWIFRSGIVPERLLAAVTRKRLQKPIARSSRREDGSAPAAVAGGKEGAETLVNQAAAAVVSPLAEPVEMAAAEAKDPAAGEKSMPLNERVMRYVKWMIQHHEGFVPAFMGCIKDAPLTDERAVWESVAAGHDGKPPPPICVILGREDEIIDPEMYAKDALPLLGGNDKVLWEVISGGHDFPMTADQQVLTILGRFWKGME